MFSIFEPQKKSFGEGGGTNSINPYYFKFLARAATVLCCNSIILLEAITVPFKWPSEFIVIFHQVLILFQIQHSSHNRPQEYPPKIEQLHFEEKYSRSELIF